MIIGNGQFLHGDCLELMREIPDGSVDMVLCDLPYGTTACSWDSVIPFEPLWEQYWRVCKPNAAVVLTSAQPFTTALIGSQMKFFKYCWVWEKNKPTGHLNAKKQPLRISEDICIFYRAPCLYQPQMTVAERPDTRKTINASMNRDRGVYNGSSPYSNVRSADTGKRYPLSTIRFDKEPSPSHPTQKPVALFEYLIRTYTNEGEHVLDNTAGSGTTAIAAENSGRRWTCIERDPTYYEAAIARVWDHLTP